MPEKVQALRQVLGGISSLKRLEDFNDCDALEH
jgi:hypothetical protein